MLGFRIWKFKGDRLALPESDTEPQLWTGFIDLGMNLGRYDLGTNKESLRTRRIGVKYGQCAFDNLGRS